MKRCPLARLFFFSYQVLVALLGFFFTQFKLFEKGEQAVTEKCRHIGGNPQYIPSNRLNMEGDEHGTSKVAFVTSRLPGLAYGQRRRKSAARDAGTVEFSFAHVAPALRSCPKIAIQCAYIGASAAQRPSDAPTCYTDSPMQPLSEGKLAFNCIISILDIRYCWFIPTLSLRDLGLTTRFARFESDTCNLFEVSIESQQLLSINNRSRAKTSNL